MEQPAELAEEPAEVAATMEQPAEVAATMEQPVEVAEKYDLHIKIAEEMRQTLKNSTDLAYAMGEIAKPDLVDLMSLFIGWGLTILKKKWLDSIGYK